MNQFISFSRDNRRIHFIVLLLSVLLFSSFSLNAQNISGRIIDSETLEPIPHARISVEYYEIADSLFCYSNNNGDFVLQLDSLETVDLYFEHYDYYGRDTFFNPSGDINLGEIELRSRNWDFYLESNTAFQLSAAVDFISLDMFTEDGNFKSILGLEIYSYNFNFFPESPIQMGMKLNPIKLKWTNFKDHISLVNTPTLKERYFSASGSIGLYARFRFSSENMVDVPFCDIGINYEVPYLKRYTFYTDENTKTSIKGIQRYNDFNAIGRIGYGMYALKVEYRLTNSLKNGYLLEPKLLFGLEVLLPLG